MKPSCAFALLIWWLLTALLSAQEARFRERVDVERVLVDARVVDGQGRAILGLEAADFRMRVDGKPVVLESVQWVSGTNPEVGVPGSPGAAAKTDGPGKETPSRGVDASAAAGVSPGFTGRLIVLFFQKSFESSRLGGLLRMQHEALKLIESLTAADRVAVLTFDSHLKLHLDFTNDRGRLQEVAGDAMRLGEPQPLPMGPVPSLAAHFDRDAARKAATPETALLVTARALEPVPGAKSLVLFGWGLGRFGITGVRMEPDYEPARRALTAARVAVFSLDVTDADYHSLEVGLEQVSADTGGFYTKTHVFPRSALAQLEGALAGHYLLSFEKPSLPPGTHRITIDLVRRKGTILAKSSYEG